MKSQKLLRQIVKLILTMILLLALGIIALAQDRRFGLDENTNKDKQPKNLKNSENSENSEEPSSRRYFPTEINRRFGLTPGESEPETIALAPQLTPQRPKSPLKIAQQLAEQGYLERAVVSYKKAIVAKEQLNLAYFGLGHSLIKLSKFDEAIKAFRQVLSLSPNNAEAYLNLGSALYCTGQSDEAITHYNRAIEINKGNFPNADFNLALIFFHQGNFDEAIKHYKNAIQYKEIYPAAYNNLGLVYEATGDFEKALANFQKAIKQKQNLYPLAHYNLGRYYFNQGKFFPEAVTEIELAIKQRPNFPEAFLVLGNIYMIYETKGGVETVAKAKSLYQKAITLYSDYSLAHENLAIAYTRLKEKKEALKEYRIAFNLSSNYSPLLLKNLLATITDNDSFLINDEYSRPEDLTGVKLSKQNRYNSREVTNSVLEQYEQLSNEEKALPDIHYCFGKVYISIGNWKAAANELRFALELSNGKDSEATNLLKFIYKLAI